MILTEHIVDRLAKGLRPRFKKHDSGGKNIPPLPDY